MCDLILKVGNNVLLHKLKCSILGRAILIFEITYKFTKILFCDCQFLAPWQYLDDKIYYETYKKDLSNINSLSRDIH